MSCAYGVQLNLSKLPGVESCKVSYRDGSAVIVYADGAKPDLAAIEATVAEFGYRTGQPTVRAER